MHLGRSCGDFPGLPVVWIDNFKKTGSDPVHEPGHIKCRDIGSPGSGKDDFRGRVQGSTFRGSKVHCFMIQGFKDLLDWFFSFHWLNWLI